MRPPTLKHPEVKFRQGATSLVPYIELEFPVHAMKEVVVGPGGNPDLRRMAVQRLLEVHGADVEVRTSKVPYRASAG